MNCFQIEVRGITFTIWAPTIQDALETFMIDMEFYEGLQGENDGCCKTRS